MCYLFFRTKIILFSNMDNHFREVTKMVDSDSGTKREIKSFTFRQRQRLCVPPHAVPPHGPRADERNTPGRVPNWLIKIYISGSLQAFCGKFLNKIPKSTKRRCCGQMSAHKHVRHVPQAGNPRWKNQQQIRKNTQCFDGRKFFILSYYFLHLQAFGFPSLEALDK